MRIAPNDSRISYMGRVDWRDAEKPTLIFVGTTVTLRFRGSGLSVRLINKTLWNMNLIGVKLDDAPFIRLPINLDDREREYVLAQNLGAGEHTLSLVKVQDSTDYITLTGFMLPEDGELLQAPALPRRRMEFFGDSVTSGCCVDAFGYEGVCDPENRGEYCNGYDSYAMMTARNLGAQVHLTSQGGVALLSGTGWFGLPHDTMGMEELYDKLGYVVELGMSDWDFSKYTPHVCVVAIGQNDPHNDGHPDIDPNQDSEYRAMWEMRYEAFIRRLMALYPKATIILTTTILRHNRVWDDMITAAGERIASERVKRFFYSNNGDGTDGHIRVSEGCVMARELTRYIESLGEGIWADE